jgi:hypothetical protein
VNSTTRAIYHSASLDIDFENERKYGRAYVHTSFLTAVSETLQIFAVEWVGWWEPGQT